MNKILTVAVVIMTCLMFSVACAKNIGFNIEYSLDPDFEPYVTEYVLEYENSNLPGTMVEVMRFQPDGMMVFDTPVFDLAPGKTSDFYLTAVYDGGVTETSEPYPFKFTGKPTVIRMIRK